MSNKSPGTDRRALMTSLGKVTRCHRGRLVQLCEYRVDVFSRIIPWPALAESWRVDLLAVKGA